VHSRAFTILFLIAVICITAGAGMVSQMRVKLRDDQFEFMKHIVDVVKARGRQHLLHANYFSTTIGPVIFG
jgi:hypothetical protein